MEPSGISSKLQLMWERPGLGVQRCVLWGGIVEESKFDFFLVATVAITLAAGASG